MIQPLLAVDIGNSSVKIGRFDSLPERDLPQPAALFQYGTEEPPPSALLEWLPAARCQWRIASVHRDGRWRLVYWLDRHRPDDQVQVLSHTDLPIAVQVDFPERVGLDRLAAAVAANVLREAGRGAIVVDAGSAITVDFVDVAGAFQGGAILPGFKMSAEALFGAADLLPLAILEPQAEPPPAVGKNTDAAIRSGLFWGAVGAVRELISGITREQKPAPQVFITGGDLRRLAEQLGPKVEFIPNLVLAGIAVAAKQ
jgi:type III pantothenate kinase